MDTPAHTWEKITIMKAIQKHREELPEDFIHLTSSLVCLDILLTYAQFPCVFIYNVILEAKLVN